MRQSGLIDKSGVYGSLTLKVLAGSTNQTPVYLSKLKMRLVPKVKLAELTATLDSMHLKHEIQTCSGVKGGQAYVCYWIPGNLSPSKMK